MENEVNEDKPTVPQQKEGTSKDIDHTIKAADENDARKLFMIARNRLVDVNRWKEFSGPASAGFRLTDQNGNELSRTVEKGDLFKIALPAPGPAEGKGYDWVKVEAIEETGNPNGEKESIAIRVRPTQSPLTEGEETAHFFKDKATSSFVIERNGTEVTAAVYGRNEVPNTETNNLIDKVRNAIVGSTAILGFSNVQWKSLLKGLVETQD
ncbi:MAG TPA: hypothetical protein VGD65_16715 [Chryseosolibacter sp.]